MTPLPTSVAVRLSKLIGRLGSDHDGEVVATSRAIQRTLRTVGLDLHTLAEHVSAPPSAPSVIYRERTTDRNGPDSGMEWCRSWRSYPNPLREARSQVALCRRCSNQLSPWERRFTASVGQRVDAGLHLSSKQAAILAQITAKIEGR